MRSSAGLWGVVAAKINVIANVCTVVGLLGIFDTIWFYVTGSRSPIANIAFSLIWPSFVLYINVFAPGIIIGLGIRTRYNEYRNFGLIASVIWILAGLFLIALPVGGAAAFGNVGSMLRLLLSDSIFIAFVGYCIWQFNVLRSKEALQYFDD